MRNLFFLFIVLFCLHSFSNSNLDSPQHNWQNESLSDSIRLQTLKDYIWNKIIYTNPDSAFTLAKELETRAKDSKQINYEIEALQIQGTTYALRGLYPQSIERLNLSLKMSEKLGDSILISSSFNKLGVVYKRRGMYAEAIPYYQKSLKISKELKDTSNMFTVLNNLADVCMSMQNYEISKEYLEKVLPLAQSKGDDVKTATVLHNFGRLYRNLENDSAAISYYLEALALRKKTEHYEGIQTTLLSLAYIYRDQGRDSEYFKLIKESKDINVKTGNKAGEASASYYLGRYYDEKQDFHRAELNYSRCLTLGSEIGSLEDQKLGAWGLYSVYYQEEKGMQALEMYQLYTEIQESIQNEEAKKGLLKMEVEHEFEKQQLIAEQEAEEAARLQAEKVERRNTIQYSGIGLGIFALFGLVFLFGRIQLPNWAVELSVFLPFLILFEFLLVISDPYVDAWSSGEPLIKLGLNVLMAVLIFPAHSFLERFLKGRLFKTAV
ncbi:MAG: tetratricopeptide repeat protein [Salibacteraceae bacterium]